MKNLSDAPLRAAIVAMNAERVIGLNGDIPWHYSQDLRRFKSRTMGSAIVMGRVTWESLGCRALPGRRNIVISHNPVDAVECYHSVESALAACADQNTWIIGGGKLYSAVMDWITLLDITYVADKIEDKNAVKFPPIDWSQWREFSRENLENSDLINVVYHKI